MPININGTARLRHFKKNTFPSFGSMPLECGQCQNRAFNAYVEPRESDARVVGLICVECKNVFRLDLGAFLDGNGRARRVGLDEVDEE